MAIRTLFVDLGGVVVHANVGKTCERLAGLCGKTPSEVESLIYGKLNQDFDEGLLTEREFFLKALLELGTVDIGEHEFWDYWNDIFGINEEVVDALRATRANGVEVIAASNLDPVRFESVKATGALEVFDRLGISFQMRTRKPFKTFYRRILGLTSSAPSECLFVDDRMENTDAAIDFGLQSILYISPDALRRVLRGYGVLP